jgi:hypothetical protein
MKGKLPKTHSVPGTKYNVVTYSFGISAMKSHNNMHPLALQCMSICPHAMTWEMLAIFSYTSEIGVSFIDWAQLSMLSPVDKDRLPNVF